MKSVKNLVFIMVFTAVLGAALSTVIVLI